ncbi:MAG TPA: xanthine dehydrogenase family protein molybdopterin-binding subunit [Burkholderiales bacterium]|nr:xanthine dehydrogenase family protein molybdopterin-binding subunit [Burkholderiales bacterium]
MNVIDLNRRQFLQVSATAGGAFVLGIYWPAAGRAMNEEAGAAADAFRPNAFIRIDRNNVVTVVVGRSEMGQGVLTSLPQIVAEELDADWDKVRWQQSPAHPDYSRPGTPIMITGGSASVRTAWEPLRKAAAAARAMLLTAAAQTWGVDAAQLRTEKSAVIGPDGRRLRYGELAAKAAQLPVPQEVRLKDPQAFRIVGQSVKRLDTALKVKATAAFGLDVTLPGMLTAAIARPAAIGATVKSFNAQRAMQVPGVKRVVQVSAGVVVVADNYWAAKKGKDALEVEWDANGTLLGRSSNDIRASMEEAAKRDGINARREGDVASVTPAKSTSAVYDLPFLAHACMEPMNCTAWVRPERVDVWTGTQAQTAVQQNGAAIAGLKQEQIFVHTAFLGGGFGRRAAQDFVISAIEASKAVGAPVKLVYSREDDMKAAYYRPVSYTEISGGVDEKGEPVMLKAKVVVPSLAEFSGFKRLLRSDGVDRVAVEGLADMPYHIPNLHVDWVNYGPGIPIWFWRSVGATHNTFVTETFIDELAQLSGRDPLEFRLSLLAERPRHSAVLRLAAEKAGWGSPLPAGRARGIAVVECFAGWTAEVAEVSIEKGKPRVHRVVCAADCGRAINPEQVRRQMESAIVYALSAALYGQITFKDGMVEQSNFDDYPVLRMNETPQIEVHLVESTEDPGGVGEPGTPTLAPAVANALARLTGKRIHTLPLSKIDLTA